MMDTLFNILWEALGLAILSTPLVWESWNDKDGDAHVSRAGWNETVQMLSKRVDIYARITFAVSASMVTDLLGFNTFIPSLIMSGAIHFLFFDYIIVYILVRNGVISPTAKWWDYLGSKGFDNYEWWSSKDWRIRMAIKVAAFMIACAIYF